MHSPTNTRLHPEGAQDRASATDTGAKARNLVPASQIEQGMLKRFFVHIGYWGQDFLPLPLCLWRLPGQH